MRVRFPRGSGAQRLPVSAMPGLAFGGMLVAMGVAGGRLAAQPPPANPFRTIDGTGTHAERPLWGSAGSPLLRLAPPGYLDGRDRPAGVDRPSPRAISNALCAQTGDVPNELRATDFVWQWGQFLDHDLSLTEAAEPAEPMPIPIPAGDAWFDPFGTGTQVIAFHRSAYVYSPRRVREQVNDLTAYIDGSQVYGSDPATARLLRGAGGRMRTSAGDLLPLDQQGFFVAGDVRANEQVGLTAMHTLFVREHNRLATMLGAMGFDADATWSIARAIVGAELQAITYREFLPVLLGPGALRPYAGYRAEVDPGIANEFANASYRLGHSMLSPTLLRLDSNGDTISAGDLPLRDAFFAPDQVRAHGIDPILRGLAARRAQRIDTRIVDDVRNFLFGPPGAGGFDLASLNLQRGRDHGLASYVETRRAYGLPAVRGFADVTRDLGLQRDLRATYGQVESVDLWLGGLAEDHVPGAMVGPLFRRVLAEQFERLRDGDPFWYERSLPAELVAYVNGMTLARVIRANTAVGDELPDDVFRLPLGRADRHGDHTHRDGRVRSLAGRSLEQARRLR